MTRHVARLEAEVLGDLVIRVDGRPVPSGAWERRDARRLVELLLVTPGHRLRRATIIDTLWPEREPDAGLTALRKALYFAHRALGDPELLAADRETVGLVANTLDLDLDRLAEAMDTIAAEQGAGGAAVAMLNQAAIDAATTVARLGLRDLLADEPYEGWAQEARTRLWMTVHRSLLLVARHLLHAGRHAEALALVDAILAREPSDEAAHRLAIELYVADGRHEAARQQLDRCRTVLRTELGVEPSAATIAALGPVREASRGPRAPADRWLVGRDAERRRMEEAIERAAGGGCVTVLLLGPAGIGKTRLLRELTETARTLGWRTLEWHAADDAMPEAYTPVHAFIASEVAAGDVAAWDEPARSAAAALVPGLGLDVPVASRDPGWLVAGIRAAITRLAWSRPLLLAWDDVTMLDRQSLELLASIVGEADPTAPLLVACTVRDDEPIPHAVSRLRDTAARNGGVEIHLDPLGLGDIEPLLVSHLGGESLQAALRDTLYDASAGNPLYCLDLAKAWRDEGRLERLGGTWRLRRDGPGSLVPPSAARLVAERSARLSVEAHDLLAVAAELPADISHETLARAMPAGRGGLAVPLDGALGSGLLVEREAGYAFAHPVFRQAFRDSLGGARRARVCLGIARTWGGVADDADVEEVLAAVATCEDPVPVAEQAIEAVRLGEPGARLLAAAFGFAAGAHLRSRRETARAASVLTAAVRAWDGLASGVAGRLDASQALVHLGQLRVLAGEDEAGVDDLMRAAAVARTPDELARAYLAAARVPWRHGDPDAALGVLRAALGLLPADARTARAHVEREIGLVLLRLEGPDAADPLLTASMQVFENANDPMGRMRSLAAVGALLAATGRRRASISLLEQAIALARDLRDPVFETTCRLRLARSLADDGQLALAREQASRALELSRLSADRYDEAIACAEAADVEDRAGRPETAAALRHEQLRLLEAIGGNPHDQAWAHVHLALIEREQGDPESAAWDAASARRLAATSPVAVDAGRVEQALHARPWADASGA